LDQPIQNISQLLDIMAQLRDPVSGCPWDTKQNFKSIAPYTIEEAYEVADAIEREDFAELRDELGDLLLQVVFHSQMALEKGYFEFGDVVASICDKMTRRHPHIFAARSADNVEASSSEAVVKNWEAIKAEERERKQDQIGALAGVAKALPALLRAQKVQKRAARVGFDWPDVSGAKDKVREELTELDDAGSPEEQFEEMGDLLFAMVNVARHLNIDAEAALKSGTAKFERRFAAMEAISGDHFPSLSLSEKEALWERAKANE
jgi:nucleoside triphosphate diphosphatase